ncbi:hypothetical protein PsorP6_007352 [Peronosclerospora sorghi]|uniref:Uncharacterized protein n=1 Tax=Peronosclerospora sorghi TaxID=230839 RepID=A0ACC0W861_9STRA|nr:hypothetical protein PsorP6_007352 [Peronosclerospora sorghi]
MYFTVAGIFGQTSARNCTVEEQAGGFAALTSLLEGKTLARCSKFTGYSLLEATELPTSEEQDKMCDSKACLTVIGKINAAHPPNCVVKVPTSGLNINMHQYAKNVQRHCISKSGNP